MTECECSVLVTFARNGKMTKLIKGRLARVATPTGFVVREAKDAVW
jgi:hypothetical protein